MVFFSLCITLLSLKWAEDLDRDAEMSIFYKEEKISVDTMLGQEAHNFLIDQGFCQDKEP